MYLLKMEDREPVLQPVLFKTVRFGRESYLWSMRKSVLLLKLLDVVVFQREHWRGMANKFRLGCHDIIPPCDLDCDLIDYFSLRDKQVEFTLPPWKQAVYSYEYYLRKMEETEDSQVEGTKAILSEKCTIEDNSEEAFQNHCEIKKTALVDNIISKTEHKSALTQTNSHPKSDPPTPSKTRSPDPSPHLLDQLTFNHHTDRQSAISIHR